MILRLMAASLALLALTACDNTTARYSSDYASKLERNEILILPVYAEAYTVSTSGETREYDYEEHVEPILADELKKKLDEKGYHTRILRKADLMKDKTYREYEIFRTAFKEAYEEEYKTGQVKKREEAANSTMRLKDTAKTLGAKVGAPVMAYVEYNEKVTATDAQVVGFIAKVALAALLGSSGGSAPPDTSKVIIALIDAENNKVLWTNAGASAGGGLGAGMVYTDDEQSMQHVRTSLDWSLRELPKREDLYKKAED